MTQRCYETLPAVVGHELTRHYCHADARTEHEHWCPCGYSWSRLREEYVIHTRPLDCQPRAGT